MPQFDAIVVFTADWDEYDENPKRPPRPSLRSKMRTLAALEMVKKGLTNSIVFCGGVTGRPKQWQGEWPSHAQLIYDLRSWTKNEPNVRVFCL